MNIKIVAYCIILFEFFGCQSETNQARRTNQDLSNMFVEGSESNKNLLKFIEMVDKKERLEASIYCLSSDSNFTNNEDKECFDNSKKLDSLKKELEENTFNLVVDKFLRSFSFKGNHSSKSISFLSSSIPFLIDATKSDKCPQYLKDEIYNLRIINPIYKKSYLDSIKIDQIISSKYLNLN